MPIQLIDSHSILMRSHEIARGNPEHTKHESVSQSQAVIWNFVTLVLLSLLIVSVQAGVPGSNHLAETGSALGLPGQIALENSSVEILFFYDPSCSECQQVLSFLPGFITSHPNVTVMYHDISSSHEIHDLFHQYRDRYHSPYSSVPAIFVGQRGLSGYDEITADLDNAVREAAADQPSPLAIDPKDKVPSNDTIGFGSPYPTPHMIPAGMNSTVELLFFYNPNCHECQQVLSFLPGLLASYPMVNVTSHDIFNNPENHQLFQKLNERYNRPFSEVPAIFVGDRELVGFDEISMDLEVAIQSAGRNQTPLLPLDEPVTPDTIDHGPTTKSTILTIPVIITAAIVDGFNPCAFAVLTFLLITIIVQQSRKQVLAVGSVYIVAVFIFYFLSGLGLFTLVQVSGMSRLFSIIAAVLALIAGLLMIRDAFNVNSPVLAIPESKKKVIDQYITNVTLPVAFILGILVGIFELPCTGGIYLAILSLLSQSMTLSAGIPLLLLYNVFFIVPLIVVLARVYWGLPPERFRAFHAEHRMAVRLCMAALMIGIAAFLLYSVFS